MPPHHPEPLSGLDLDDPDEDDNRAALRPDETMLPSPRPQRPPPLPPVGDLFSDTATRVARYPSLPSASQSALASASAADVGVTVDASVTHQAKGALDVPVRREKSDHPEPTITVASDLLLDGAGVPATENHDQGIARESTLLFALPKPSAVPPDPAPAKRHDSGPFGSQGNGSSPFSSLTRSNGHQEKTRVVSLLKLAELDEPRSKKARDQPQLAVDEPTLSPPPQDEAPPVPGKQGKQKKKPIQQVKAKSKAKPTPIDPERLRVQQEAAERKEDEEKSGLHRFFERSGLISLTGAGESSADSTMIGRFLGLVGLNNEDRPGGREDPVQQTWEVVQHVAFLDGLNPQFIDDAIRTGDLKLIRAGRDMLVDTEGRALLVSEGQLALARFKPEVLEKERRAQRVYRPGDKKAEKREHKRRQEAGPLIRMCETNLALFSAGDLVGLETSGTTPGVAVYSVTPVKLLSLSRARLETWRRTYQFFGDRMRRAADAARKRIAANSGARSLVADFFVRHGLSVGMSLRVRELDKCIECYECEKACEDRYGVKRLSLNGKILGALDFVDCCRTCVDQRCIDPCAFDAIRFDTERKEVLIAEEACTGCTLCAVACPYDAIEMCEMEEKPLLRLRLERAGKLGFGEGKPRKAKLRRIASKCDHCISYEDQACISACPTAALLEIPPEAAFVERTESLADAAKGGFDHTALVDAAQLFNPRKFIHGLKAEDDKGRSVENRLNTVWIWIVGLLAFLGCFAEIALRHYRPRLSLLFYHQTMVEGLDPDVALQNIDFRPGSDYAVWLGWIGTVVMFSSMFYSARKWIPWFKRLGSQRAWFDYHVWSGTIGPLFILLHSAAKLDNWVSLGVWSMVATSLSGLVGRYLSTELPDLASQATLHVLDLDRQLAELRNRHAGVAVADRYYATLRKRFARVADPDLSTFRAGWMALTMLGRDEVMRLFRVTSLRLRLTGIKDRTARAQVARLTSHLALLERRRVLLPRIEPIFREWKNIHVPFAIVLTVLSAIHITLELIR
jgi:Fe-S-cluster-containing hydrogenase component 2